MKIILFVLLQISFSLSGQIFLPTKDTIFEKDGNRIEYKVQEHAVFMTTYRDGKWNGPAKAYYKNGRIWSEDTRVNGQLSGKAVSYTDKGEIATIEEWQNGVLINKKIFYQNTVDDPQKYFFVSKTGFDLIKNGTQVPLGTSTPDSLIEENPYGAYIWINGQKKLFSGVEAPKFKLIKNGSRPGLYQIDSDGKQTFIRPLTKGEKE